MRQELELELENRFFGRAAFSRIVTSIQLV